MLKDYSFSCESISVSAHSVICNNMARCHTHTSYELYYLIEGERYLFAEGAFYNVCEGDLFLIPPGVEHRTLDSGSGKYFRLTANIPEESMPRGARVRHVRFVTPSERNGRRLISEAREIMEGDGSSPFTECRVLGAVMKMLSVLMSESPKEGSLGIESPTIARVSEILSYIDSHITEKLTLTGISERFFISEFYLCRLFKEYTGRTIFDYITDRRVQLSARLLLESRDNVASVASSAGFGSVSSFGLAFKRRLGVTPREYRANNMEKNIEGVRQI